jgi:hypothetical protein
MKREVSLLSKRVQEQAKENGTSRAETFELDERVKSTNGKNKRKFNFLKKNIFLNARRVLSVGV